MKNFKKLVVLVVLLSACKFNLHAQFYGCMSNDLLALHNVPTAPQLTSDVMVVPVVVHVLHYSSDNVVGVGSNISDAQVLDAIQKLNDAYRNTAGLSTDMEIQFCLAKKDPNGDNTSGIDRIPKNLFPSYPNFVEGAIGTLNASEIQFYNDFNWDSHYYLNIWVSDEIRSRAPSGNLNNPLTFPIYGASIIPSVPNGNTYLLNTTRDGVWIRNDEFGTIGTAYNSSVGWLVHEVGHWLNLIHLEEGTPCGNEDGLSDTPSYSAIDLNNATQQGYVCGTPFTSTSCSSTFIPEYYMMGYVPQYFDQCFAKFTPMQKTTATNSLAVYRPDCYYINGQVATTRCGCVDITSLTTSVNLVNNFSIGENILGVQYSPFDQNYAVLSNWNPPSHNVNNINVPSATTVLVNNESGSFGSIGDYTNGSYIDLLGVNSDMDFSLDGERLTFSSGSSMTIGDQQSTPIRQANFNLECSSLLEINSGATITLYARSKIVVKKGGTLLIRNGANIQLFDQARIEVESGGYICVESGANILLANYVNVVALSPNSIQGVNPSLGVVSNCGTPIAFTGNGIVTCLSENYTDPNGIQVNSGGVVNWNSSKSIKGQIFITNNTTLIISGASTVIEMAETRSCGEWTNIVVDRGSKLIIENGATIQGNTECDGMWDGIQVWGNRLAPQTPLSSGSQGQIIIRSGGTIKDAYEGVALFRADQFGNIDWSYTGGIVMANDANFINCGRAVNFLSYRSGNSNNVSYFYNCRFITNGRLNNPLETPRSFVSMFDVKGVRFFGCTFENLTPQQYLATERGTGIVTADASYFIDSYCTSSFYPCPTSSVQRTRFANLFYGVYSSDVTPFNAIRINNSDFVGNNRGVILRGMDYSVVTNCVFDVGTLEIVNNTQYLPYGLYLEHCNGYQVEQNNFTTSIVGNVLPTGLAVYYSGSQPNLLYNNMFDNLYVGILVMEENGGGMDNDGLVIKCNDFGQLNVNEYDVALTDNGTINYYQGTNLGQTGPAGNRFSHSCLSPSFDNDIAAGQSPYGIEYVHNAGLPTTPSCYSQNTVSLVQTNTILFNKATSCPPTFNNCDRPCVRDRMQQAETSESSLKSLIDGGNTSVLLNVIATGTPGAIKTTLLGFSPYLSDTVLISVIKRPNPLPPGTVKDIIIANSPVSPTVNSALQSVVLPNGIRNQINAAQIGVSARSLLDGQISYFQDEQVFGRNELIRRYLLDSTIVNGVDSVGAILKGEQNLESKCKLVSFYIHKGDYASALQLLDSLDNAGHSDNFCKLQRYLIELKQDVNGCFKLKTDSILTEKVTDVAHDCCDKGGCANAQALLTLVFGQNFPEVIELPTNSTPRMQQLEVGKEGDYRVFPNPSSGDIYLAFPDSIGDENGTLMLFDINGQIVLTQQIVLQAGATAILNTEVLSTGVYFISLTISGVAVLNERIVILRD
jgi:hypothetical protein